MPASKTHINERLQLNLTIKLHEQYLLFHFMSTLLELKILKARPTCAKLLWEQRNVGALLEKLNASRSYQLIGDQHLKEHLRRRTCR